MYVDDYYQMRYKTKLEEVVVMMVILMNVQMNLVIIIRVLRGKRLYEDW
jgi:hypothetical protein